MTTDATGWLVPFAATLSIITGNLDSDVVLGSMDTMLCRSPGPVFICVETCRDF